MTNPRREVRGAPAPRAGGPGRPAPGPGRRPGPPPSPVGGVQFYSPFYRGGANQIVKPPGLTQINPSTLAGPFQITWPANGRVLAMQATACLVNGSIGTTEYQGFMKLRFDMNDETNFVFGGDQSVRISTISPLGVVSPWFSLNIPVRANDQWNIYFQNEHPSAPLRPELLFAVQQSPDGKIPPSPMRPRGTERREFPQNVNYAPYFAGGANRLVIPDNLPTFAAPMPPGALVQPLKLRWPKDAKVLGMYGSAFAPDQSVSMIDAMVMAQLLLDRRGERNLISNGQAADYACFGQLFPLSSPWFPLDYDVRSNEVWFTYLQNVATGTTNITPDLAFAIYDGEP